MRAWKNGSRHLKTRAGRNITLGHGTYSAVDSRTQIEFIYNICLKIERPWERRRPRRLTGENIENFRINQRVAKTGAVFKGQFFVIGKVSRRGRRRSQGRLQFKTIVC
jgi:hypothetical protein